MLRRPKDDYYERYVHRMMTRFNEDYHRRVRGHVPSDPESEEETDKPARTQCLKPLKVSEVDTHPAKNSRENHTELYEIIHGYRPTAVLRRGFSFVLTLKFDREYEITKDVIKIKFGIGETFPIHHSSWLQNERFWVRDPGALRILFCEAMGPYCIRRKNTLVCFVVTDKRQMELCSHIWDYKVIERKDKTLSLMTRARLWRGTADSPEGRPWVFGQFHHVVLPAITLLLAKFDMPCDTRGDPIELVRALSSIVST
uniref:Transglutaminase N-terminal domain-containing protein n=1 Tax=Timema bartmani TaxID=61472 RepID=A0A7R9EPH7_9NEOP|nr:unnamed protein product [Timema bartmani]